MAGFDWLSLLWLLPMAGAALTILLPATTPRLARWCWPARPKKNLAASRAPPMHPITVPRQMNSNSR